MKKLSILLIGLLLVTGFAFADGHIAVTGSASVTWGIDLNTNATGFMNSAASTLVITLADKASGTTGGDDGLYGEITLKDWTASASATDTLAVTAGAVSAKLVVDPAEILIYSAPGMSWGNATVIETGDTDIAPALAGANTIGGVTIVLPVDPATIKVYVVSDGDWTSNAANDYAAGTDLSVVAGPATISLGGFYGWFNAAATWGGTAKVALAVGPADVTVGVDLVDGVSWEVDFGAVVDLSEANADDKMTTLAVDVFYSAAADLDAAVTFTEVGAGGLVDMLASTVAVAVYNLTGTLGWSVDADNSYDTGDMKPYLNFGYGSDTIFDLQVGVDLKAGLTGIDNTTITLDYISTDLSADNGIITVKAAVKY